MFRMEITPIPKSINVETVLITCQCYSVRNVNVSVQIIFDNEIIFTYFYLSFPLIDIGSLF